MVELVDTRDLKSLGQEWLCGFESRSRHFFADKSSCYEYKYPTFFRIKQGVYHHFVFSHCHRHIVGVWHGER